jgi:putative ABC transport system substrate-binding protein
MRDGLHELGYRENEHFVIGVRFTQGDFKALPGAARDLVRQGVDLIVAAGGNSGTAAQAATQRIPIIVLGGRDPVAAGLVKSYARPGGNVTGVVGLDRELTAKRMEIFRELVPGLKRLFVPYDATTEVSVAQLARYRDAARRLGIVLVEKPVRSEAEAGATIAQLRRSEADGIFAPAALSLNIPGLILETAPRLALPVMFDQPFYVERGGLASYSRNEQELGRQAARIVDRIIKGAKPAEIPVERPTKFELVVNLKTAKALGITIPPSVLLQASRVIE